jgi:transcriptional regulator with XRE-family HTH domain
VPPDSDFPRIAVQFGCRLRAVRLDAGLTQRQLAARANVAPAVLADIENGGCDPDLKLIGRLAKALGCAAFELIPF